MKTKLAKPLYILIGSFMLFLAVFLPNSVLAQDYPQQCQVVSEDVPVSGGIVRQTTDCMGTKSYQVVRGDPSILSQLKDTFSNVKGRVEDRLDQITICPFVRFDIPASIQPNNTINLGIRTYDGFNWDFVTLSVDGQNVPGGQVVKDKSEYNWPINSGNPGVHTVDFYVNDYALYNVTDTAGRPAKKTCGRTQFTTNNAGVVTPTTQPGQSSPINSSTTITQPVQSPIATQNPVTLPQTGGYSVQCPSNTSPNLQDNTVVCVQNINTNTNTINNTVSPTIKMSNLQTQPATVSGEPRVIKVAGSNVNELPRTGLPEIGLGLLGLIPVGWGLRRFAKGKSKPSSANSVWEEKNFRD